MEKLTIIDKEYVSWVKDLASRYRQSQIKAAVKVNAEQIKFNFLLGRDLVEMHVEERWGQSVLTQLSTDLRKELPGLEGLSKSNLYYCKKFYNLYTEAVVFFHQLGGIFQVPWRHHCVIMDKIKGDREKALFYVRKTIENGWSRAMLLNFLDTNLYEREGKAITNFTATLPEPMSDLAKAITKDYPTIYLPTFGI